MPNIEENALFIAIFGWYPILRPSLQKLPGVLRWICKILVFNITVVAAEWLVLTFLAPQVLESVFAWILLGLGNVTFVTYDFLVPKMQIILHKIFHN